jgi:tellurite resistance protein
MARGRIDERRRRSPRRTPDGTTAGFLPGGLGTDNPRPIPEEETMASKANFTEQEWDDLQQGVTGAGMLVSAAHRDFTDSFGEASSIAKQLAAHRQSDSQLIRDLSSTHGTGFGLIASPDEVTEGTIKALDGAVAVLHEKAPDELEAYRQLVLDVATATAEAKGGVRDEETAAIERIKRALGGSTETSAGNE